MNKKAIIIGVEGQDGRILFDLLLKKGYQIIGISKNNIITNNTKWSKKIDIVNSDHVFDLVKKYQPHGIYHLATYHHSSQEKQIADIKSINKSYEINVLSLLNILESVRLYSTHTKIFYAASSLIFGGTKTRRQNESTPFCPETLYGINKLDGLLLCRYYRANYGIFASVGILYNHESKYRPEKYLSKKVIQGVIDIKNGIKKELILGNLSAKTDWGDAFDFVDAMHKILSVKKSDEFIIASGKSHTVQDFVKIAFDYFGMDWKKFVKEDSKIIKRNNGVLIGNPTKIKNICHWQAKTNFKDMIIKIINELDK